MGTADTHLLKDFDHELDEIRALVSQAGGLAEAAIHEAVEALLEHDDRAAAKVIGANFKIEQQTREIERQCVRLIALRAPLANDLRAVLASFQIALVVERIGDCARNIAEQVRTMGGYEFRSALRVLQSTAAAVRDVVKCCLDAYAGADGLKASEVCEKRDAVRILNERLFRELLDTISDNPARFNGLSSLLLVSQKLERIADHASEIGKAVYFSATGAHLCAGEPLSPGQDARL